MGIINFRCVEWPSLSMSLRSPNVLDLGKCWETVLKLVFAAPIPYDRNTGFQTTKTTIPFKVLGDLKDEECVGEI